MRHTTDSDFRYQKIPALPEITSWKEVEIWESGEKLISLNNLYPERISVSPQYFLQGIKSSLEESLVRETVADMLLKASSLLPPKYKFFVWDAWRSIETQKAIFDRYRERLKNQNPTLNEDELITLIQKYVSFPSLDEKCPPPHSTGGAIDLSIVDQFGNYLDMGTPYDEFDTRANIRYFEEKIEIDKSLSNNDMIILKNRRLLFNTMIEKGFTNYPMEWWHYDYGNQFWAKIKGVNAIYGRVDLRDLDKGI
jgi:zinc D-Ala-D-Ala dipeptidase